jgi:predicted secreted protein
MTLLQLSFTYLVTWWILLFAFLPIGSAPPAQRDPMHYAGAPAKPDLWRKFLWNSLASAVVTGGIDLLVMSGWIPLRHVIQ